MFSTTKASKRKDFIRALFNTGEAIHPIPTYSSFSVLPKGAKKLRNCCEGHIQGHRLTKKAET
jgi:hypothetical protein